MEHNVQDLVRKLCEKHIDKSKYEGTNFQNIMKKLRAKSFEILLKKQPSGCTLQVTSTKDPICHLLAWACTLKNELNQPEAAKALVTFTESLETNPIINNPIVQDIMLFLIYLRNSPKSKLNMTPSDVIAKMGMKYKSNPIEGALPYNVYPAETFILSPLSDMNTESSYQTFSLKSFTSKPTIDFRTSFKPIKPNDQVLPYKMDYKFTPLSDDNLIELKPSNDDREEMCTGVENRLLGNNIWEIALRLPPKNYYSWETLDNFNPLDERPFATEAGPEVLHHLYNIAMGWQKGLKLDYTIEVVDYARFVKCLKNMLVGIISDIFLLNEQNIFYLRKGVQVEGILEETLNSYCVELMKCGSCYRALNQLCYENQTKNAYIFKELCENVRRYLLYYRIAILSLSNTEGLLKIDSYLTRFKNHMNTLARICRVGIFPQKPLQGAKLLDYIYNEIINTIDDDLILVLYSVFQPCCQNYFSRFLQKWLFEGILNDPYEEFLVKPDMNYINSRTRTYWTRNFTLRQNAGPEFLTELNNEILQCGKTMNLLKLCKPDAVLYPHISGRFSSLVLCCLTPDQLNKQKQEIDRYYVELASLCGPRISLYHKLQERYEENLLLLSLAEKKRVLTNKKYELMKQQQAEEKAKKKQQLLKSIQEQMAAAIEQKKKAKEEELQRELMIVKQNAQIEEMRSKLVTEESRVLLKYYTHLIEAVDKRRSIIEKRKKQLKEEEQQKQIHFEQNNLEQTNLDQTNFEHKNLEQANFEQTEDLIKDINKNINSETDLKQSTEVENNLDIINANVDQSVQIINERNETLLAAKRNKQKVLNLEFGVHFQEPIQTELIHKHPTLATALTEAQRNKMKVLSSEFDLICPRKQETINENANNNNDNNKIVIPKSIASLASPGHEEVMNTTLRKEILTRTVSEVESISQNEPMSIDSTPNVETVSTPSSSTTKLSLCTDNVNFDLPSGLLTANSNFTDDGFKFPVPESKRFEYDTSKFMFNRKKIALLERVPEQVQFDLKQIKSSNLKILLYESVYASLQAQTKLVNNEILKYFVHDQNFFSHLHSLRCYYFLLDGEFGRDITEGLFQKLYEAKNPWDLLNYGSLQLIINHALYASSKYHENGEKLSFIVQTVPSKFDLNNIDVLECLSLSYKIDWPLNILLPADTIEKYDFVFKYLLKLHHVSWILQKVFMDLEICAQEMNVNGKTLKESSQYRQVQMYRFTMTHFIQTLQNYTVNEVLQISWEEFENNMKTVETLDQLYSVHTIYVKTILFRCLLNKNCAPIMKVIREIFIVVLRFYNYLKNRSWFVNGNCLVHPNFKKLKEIFNKFEEYTNFVFRVGHKMARVGYQPHLTQMLDMLDLNGYYSRKQK